MSQRETQEKRNRELWADEKQAQAQDEQSAAAQAGEDAMHWGDETSEQAQLFPARRIRRGNYRFPRTPTSVRLDGQVRIDETLENITRFRRLTEKVQTRLRVMRVPEAVIVRSLRHYLVQHEYAFLHAFAQIDVGYYGGRVITEPMVLEVLGRIFPVRPGLAQEGSAGARPPDSRVAS